ncbi:abortive infection family protein [Burkholderia gladioli]|uniref:abortive infection family protein n=1 Tax=Burkholderia gladioli TaxID=28095 RepID=UPI0022D80486|nr:abortive infection family protein [Burkholderia gladioli]MDA0574117.1 abortive infection family protein [Burkholderia gladioli]MDA0602314.1 abortive infection family protein [Burkholderia gladioli]
MRDQIQAQAARLKRIEAKEASIRKLARDFAAALREELEDLDVSGSSRIVLVSHPNGDKGVTIPAWLNYEDGSVVVVYQPGGTVVWTEPGPPWLSDDWSWMHLDQCRSDWLGQLLDRGVIASLIESLGGDDIEAREARIDEALALVQSVLSTESAAIDAEMLECLAVTGDDILSRLWREAVDATNQDSADALTRCSRFLEAVCSTILRDRRIPFPKDKSMSPLVKACLEVLTWPAEKEAGEDVKKILGGIQSITNGIGALRTHFGTAHGATSHLPPLDRGYAVFVKQATVAAATFLLDRHRASPLAVDDSSPGPAG